jgi:dienelactone hydrolase
MQRAFGLDTDPFHSPVGLALSPSLRHFADYPSAPLQLRYASRTWNDVAHWQRIARAKLAELCGYQGERAEPAASHQQTFSLGGGLTRRRLYLRARPAVDIPVHLIDGGSADARRPVMICLQGTNSGAHLSWGEVIAPDDADKKKSGYDLAVQAARRGYLAVAVEQSCFGERSERHISPVSPAPCVDATMHAILLGRSLLGERCSDVSAVIDWLVADADRLGVDPARIHIMGHSAGGTVAYHAAALDERIGAVLACGCIGSIRQTIGRRRDYQGQAVIPGILNWMETADVIGLVAPRAFATVAGEGDPIWPAAAAAAALAEAAATYSACGARDRLRLVSAPGGHGFRPAASWDALAAVLPDDQRP